MTMPRRRSVLGISVSLVAVLAAVALLAPAGGIAGASNPMSPVPRGNAAPGWTDVTPSAGPPPLAGAMMTYSSAAKRFVVFGGWNGTLGTDGTWVYDPANGTWTELHPAVRPMGRGDEMFVYDARSDLFVLFGGWHELANDTYVRLGDTWTFSLASGIWTQRHPATSPSTRSDSMVAYDAAADAVLLVGGFSGSSYLGDIWTYTVSNDTWTPRPSAIQPSPRSDGRLVYVASQDRLVLFGGNDYNGPNFTFHHLADTWSYDWNTNAWTLLSTPSAPPARDYPVFAVDPDAGLALLTAGYGNRTILNDIWGFNLTTNTWSDLTPSTSPPPRYAGTGGYDPVGHKFVLFSGAGNQGLLADTWVFELGSAAAPVQGLPVGILATVAVATAAVLVAVGVWIRRRRGSGGPSRP